MSWCAEGVKWSKCAGELVESDVVKLCPNVLCLFWCSVTNKSECAVEVVSNAYFSYGSYLGVECGAVVVHALWEWNSDEESHVRYTASSA